MGRKPNCRIAKMRIFVEKSHDKGFCIGSGAIESAISTVVQQRCKLVGQRWTKRVTAVLNIRAVFKSSKKAELRKLICAQMGLKTAAFSRPKSMNFDLPQNNIKKNLQTCKPDSVLPLEEFCHLSGLACHHGDLRCLPPLPRPPKRVIRARAAPVRWPKPGNKVYMAFQPARFIPLACCHTTACALTAHFHPYPGKSRGGYFL